MFAHSFIALFAVFGALDDVKPVSEPIVENKFAGRKEERIAFASQLDNFQVKRENGDEILYISTGFGEWYRAPLSCTGFGDPQYAMGIIPVDSQMGIDKFSRFKFVGTGARNDFPCSITSLIKLTPQETVELKLESQANVDKRLEKEKAKALKTKP